MQVPKYDIPTGEYKTKDKNKGDLVKDLDNAKLNSNGKVPELKSRCVAAGIPLVKQVPIVQIEYVSKPKGARYILYQRRFIGKDGLNSRGNKISWEGQIVEGPLEKGGKFPLRDPDTSVRYILQNCLDFCNEKSKLECLVEELGGKFRLTPKCHPEIAGIGIEYCWGYAKWQFRCEFNTGIPQAIDKNVLLALDTKNVLTIDRCRKFARKAHDYKLTYLYVMQNTMKGLKKEEIEQIMRAFKTHRCALNSNYSFIINS